MSFRRKLFSFQSERRIIIFYKFNVQKSKDFPHHKGTKNTKVLLCELCAFVVKPALPQAKVWFRLALKRFPTGAACRMTWRWLSRAVIVTLPQSAGISVASLAKVL